MGTSLIHDVRKGSLKIRGLLPALFVLAVIPSLSAGTIDLSKPVSESLKPDGIYWTFDEGTVGESFPLEVAGSITQRGEFFKTGALVNLGEATLDLNGLQFFVGGAELTLGDYTTFGGTVLHVIPEPATGVFVVMIFGLSVAFQRRRRRKRSPSPGVPPSSAPFIGLARGSGMLHDTVFENRMIAVQP